MTEECKLKRFVNEKPAITTYITIPNKYLEMAEQFYIPTGRPRCMEPPGQASLYFHGGEGNQRQLCAFDFSDTVQLERAQFEAPSSTPNDFNNASLVSYKQCWEVNIASRFREAKKRFPEFFPCFELLESPGKGLEYSIHFEPLTGHAKELTAQTPIFPYQKEFKPIEKLWHKDGSSELDILFERFPTQLALLPPKQPWGTRWWELLVGLVQQGLELRHIGSLLARQKA